MEEASSKSQAGKAERSESSNSTEAMNMCYIYLIYDVLRTIFPHLNGRDLSNAAMVSRLWYEAATREESFRRFVYIVGEYSYIIDKMKDLYIRPRLGILFTSSTSDMRMEEKLRDHRMFPSDCEVITLYCSALSVNNCPLFLTPMFFVCVFFPRMPNVSITTYLTVKLDKKRKRISEQLIERINCVSKVNDETSVCLMLFCTGSEGHKIAENTIADIRKSDADKKIDSLWGGTVDIGYMKNSSVQTPDCLAILISGAIQTWSIIIDYKCYTKRQIEKRLRLFKDRITLKKHSIGFMCGCIARGIYAHKSVKMEAIFKSIFPDLFIVYFFGIEEFGKNTFNFDDPKEGVCLSKQPKYDGCKRTRKMYSQFSTTIVILTCS